MTARVAISEPFAEVTQTYGSSTVAAVVGGQVGGSLTLNNVAVRNASTTMVCSDGSSTAETGTVLDLEAEVDGYTYPTLAEAVEAVVNSADKTGTVTLLKDSSGSGIGLFNEKGAVGVNLTIDFGGHTYTCTDPAVGSSGTESQGFHITVI